MHDVASTRSGIFENNPLIRLSLELVDLIKRVQHQVRPQVHDVVSDSLRQRRLVLPLIYEHVRRLGTAREEPGSLVGISGRWVEEVVLPAEALFLHASGEVEFRDVAVVELHPPVVLRLKVLRVRLPLLSVHIDVRIVVSGLRVPVVHNDPHKLVRVIVLVVLQSLFRLLRPPLVWRPGSSLFFLLHLLRHSGRLCDRDRRAVDFPYLPLGTALDALLGVRGHVQHIGELHTRVYLFVHERVEVVCEPLQVDHKHVGQAGQQGAFDHVATFLAGLTAVVGHCGPRDVLLQGVVQRLLVLYLQRQAVIILEGRADVAAVGTVDLAARFPAENVLEKQAVLGVLEGELEPFEHDVKELVGVVLHIRVRRRAVMLLEREAEICGVHVAPGGEVEIPEYGLQLVQHVIIDALPTVQRQSLVVDRENRVVERRDQEELLHHRIHVADRAQVPDPHEA